MISCFCALNNGHTLSDKRFELFKSRQYCDNPYCTCYNQVGQDNRALGALIRPDAALFEKRYLKKNPCYGARISRQNTDGQRIIILEGIQTIHALIEHY